VSFFAWKKTKFLTTTSGFGAGIIPYSNGLLICSSASGGLYYLDLTDNSVSEVLAPGSVVFADGLTIDSDGILYVAENAANRVSVWQMSTTDGGGSVSASSLGYILSPTYDDPATCDLAGDVIYCVNARFNTVPFPSEGEGDPDTFAERFQMVGVDRFDFAPLANDTVVPTVAPAMAPIMAPANAPTTPMPPTTSIAGRMYSPAVSFILASSIWMLN
jgi:hypothetical protein